jgi:hypothetical protein
MNWLRVEELALIHEMVIEETGGIQGIINPGALESALHRPFTSLIDIATAPSVAGYRGAVAVRQTRQREVYDEH